jgi:hypothetical protein
MKGSGKNLLHGRAARNGKRAKFTNIKLKYHVNTAKPFSRNSKLKQIITVIAKLGIFCAGVPSSMLRGEQSKHRPFYDMYDKFHA